MQDEKFIDELKDYNPTVPFLWRDSEAVLLVPDNSGSHSFGGELAIAPPVTLQLVVMLDTSTSSVSHWLPSGNVPLLYPFQYDGADMIYKIKDGKPFDFEPSEDEITDGWPYDEYPSSFPTRNLRETEKISLDDKVIVTILNADSESLPEGQTLLIVPSEDAESVYGVSLWGQGDGEVFCIFSIGEDGQISVYNSSS